MTDGTGKTVDLTGAEQIASTVDALVREGLAMAARRTDGGKGIDDEQVHVERLAYAATEAGAARDLLTYAASVAVQQPDPTVPAMTALFAGEIAAKLRGQIEAHPAEFGISDERLNATLGSAEIRQLMRSGGRVVGRAAYREDRSGERKNLFVSFERIAITRGAGGTGGEVGA